MKIKVKGSRITLQYVRQFCKTSYQMKKHGSSSSSHRWLLRQTKDPFVKRARDENYRCRSAFKLLQIDKKFDLLHPGMVVIDCGAAPGSWTQVAVERVNSKGSDTSKPQGFVLGIDLKNIPPIEGAIMMSACDFTRVDTQDKLRFAMNNRKADVILSDMAPSATGVHRHNHQAIINLCFSVLRFSLHILKKEGCLLCKIWMGSEQNQLEKAMKSVFSKIHTVKPDASREDSSEMFILGRGFHGLKN